MREITLNELELEIIREIRKWHRKLMDDNIIHVDEIDAGDGASLASEIATGIIGHGVGIVGEWKASRQLNEGWKD